MRVTPKILFIDDDRFFLEFYRSELAQYNVSTEFAVDGEEGIRKAKELKPDIILLDIILPKKDGFEVLEELKKDAETKDIPVIIISTLSAQEDIDRLLKLGAVKAFHKLTHLPKDVVVYVQAALKKGGFMQEMPPVAEEKEEATFLSKKQIDSIFGSTAEDTEALFLKLFNRKKAQLEDFNVSLVPYVSFKEQVGELVKLYGSIFIYGKIEAAESGVAIMAIKRDDALSLLKLIEQGVAGKEMGLTLSDKVVEEFFNIIINAFLTKLSSTISGKFLLQSPVITNPRSLMPKIEKAGIDEKNLVVLLNESYIIEEFDLSFSLFIIFSSGLFKKL